MTPSAFDRKGLLHEVLEQFKVNKRGVHGPSHWARVRHHALTVGAVAGADLLVVELFAFLRTPNGSTKTETRSTAPERRALRPN